MENNIKSRDSVAVRLRIFFTMLFFLFIGSAFLGFYYGVPVCDESSNVDCSYHLILIILITPIVLNIFLYLIVQSNRYRRLQQGKAINILTGILEIVFAPFIALFTYIIYELIYGWSPDGTWLGTLYESLFRDFFGGVIWIKILTIVIALALVVDGVVRIRSDRNKIK